MSHEGRSFKRDDYVLLQRAIQASHPESWIKQDDADFLAKDGTVPCAATIKTYPFMGSYPAVGYGHFLASLTRKVFSKIFLLFIQLFSEKDLEYFTGKIRRRLNSMTDSQKTAFAELLKKKFDIPVFLFFWVLMLWKNSEQVSLHHLRNIHWQSIALCSPRNQQKASWKGWIAIAWFWMNTKQIRKFRPSKSPEQSSQELTTNTFEMQLT